MEPAAHGFKRREMRVRSELKTYRIDRLKVLHCWQRARKYSST